MGQRKGSVSVIGFTVFIDGHLAIQVWFAENHGRQTKKTKEKVGGTIYPADRLAK
jgi:hypothetical protein